MVGGVPGDRFIILCDNRVGEIDHDTMDQNRPYVANPEESAGPVAPEALDSIVSESERVRTAVVGPAGLRRVEGDEERHVDVAVALVLTNRRIIFTAADSIGADDCAAGSLGFHELAAVDVGEDRLELSTTDGVTWRFPLPGEASDRTDAVVRDLGWIGNVRGRVVAARNDVELAAGAIRDAAADRNWEAGTDAYRDARATLDEVIQAIQLTKPVAEEHLAPNVTELERTLEGAYADLLVDRARSRLTLGQQLTENGDVEQAAEVLDGARADYEVANAHADALERGDAFRFGEQRALLNRLERLEWEVEAVIAEPLRQAHEAKLLARSTTDPAETLDYWETAFHRFGTVVALDDGDTNDGFVGDRSAVRSELGNAAGQLLGIHQTLARTAWDAGVECHEAGDTEGAAEQLSSAVEHLERAHELAVEFRPEDASAMEDRLASMRDGLRRVRLGQESVDADGTTTESTPDTEPSETGDREPITASELADLDTHHEIALDPDPTDEAESADAGELVLDPTPDDAV